MHKNKNLNVNSSQNFILRGLNSIQIGLYFLLGAFLLKSLLQGFLSDTSMLGMMSIEIIEVVGLSVTILLFLFSALAIFFSSRRYARKADYKVWNKASKTQLWRYLSFALIGIVLLKMSVQFGYVGYLAPLILILLGLILLLLNSKKKKPYYLLSLISIFLGILVFLIPSYWYSALLIVGASFLVYGIVVRR